MWRFQSATLLGKLKPLSFECDSWLGRGILDYCRTVVLKSLNAKLEQKGGCQVVELGDYSYWLFFFPSHIVLWSGVSLWNTILKKWVKTIRWRTRMSFRLWRSEAFPFAYLLGQPLQLSLWPSIPPQAPSGFGTGSGFRGGRWRYPNWNTCLNLVSPRVLNCIKDLTASWLCAGHVSFVRICFVMD